MEVFRNEEEGRREDENSKIYKLFSWFAKTIKEIFKEKKKMSLKEDVHPLLLPPPPPPSICNGCNAAVEDGIFINAFGVLWHHHCLCCLHCRNPIAMEEVSNLKRRYHELCYNKLRRPTCYICRNKIPSIEGRIEYSKHPFWEDIYCPRHDADGTSKCCSCERLKACGTEYIRLLDNRRLCLDCMETSVRDADQCHLLQLEIREFFESLNMKIEQEFPVCLVAKQVLNKADEDKIDDDYSVVTRGICLSKEHMITKVSNKQLKGMTMKSQTVFYKSKVTAILILYGFPRLLAGYILAHEMMHAYLRLNGYWNLNKALEEGLCQVLGHMWLVSQRYSTTITASSSTSSSFRTPPASTTSKKRGQSDFEKKLVEFFINQIETDESPIYGDGYRKVRQMIVLNNHNLNNTLREIKRGG